ncbi:MAG TPA: glycosyltransferase 87 family protein [Actinoplanes sp.]|nr:glycosyltransferase 87 family protein [Actinoplanes sp.]
MATVVDSARGQVSARRSIVVIVACAAVLFAVGSFAHRYGFSALALDRDAVRSWLGGDGLYAYRDPVTHLGAALPPAAAFLLIPAAVLPFGLIGWLTALTGVTALVLATIALAGPVARRYGRRRAPVVVVAVLLALAAEPTRAALGLGTLDLVLFALITADIVALRRAAWARSRAAWWHGRPASVPPRGRPIRHLLRTGWETGAWAGVGIGLATALAVGPALFIAYLAVTRQWRAASTASVTALACGIGALLMAPRETTAWFGEVLWRLDRTGGVDRIDNQSLAGVLARLYDSATTPVLLWLSFAALLVAVGFIRARSAHADGDEIAAFTVVGLTGAIAGPVSDTHELIWVLPAMLILFDAAARARLAARRPLPGRRQRPPGLGYAAAAAITYLLFVVAPMWTLADLGGLATNSYALALILLVNALPCRPGVAPAFPVNRWVRRRSGARPVPPARRPMGS